MCRIPNRDHLLGGELYLWIDKASCPKTLGTAVTPMLEPEMCVAELLTPCSSPSRKCNGQSVDFKNFENFCFLKYELL